MLHWLSSLVLPPLPPEDKLWLKPYVDLQAYEDPAQGALDFAQELDPAWLIVDTVIGEGKLCCDPHLVSSVWWRMAATRFLSSSLEFPREPMPALSCILEFLCPGAASSSYTLCSVVLGFLIKNVKYTISTHRGVNVTRCRLFSEDSQNRRDSEPP